MYNVVVLQLHKQMNCLTGENSYKNNGLFSLDDVEGIIMKRSDENGSYYVPDKIPVIKKIGAAEYKQTTYTKFTSVDMFEYIQQMEKESSIRLRWTSKHPYTDIYEIFITKINE